MSVEEKKKVLIVDDYVENLMVLNNILKDEYSVTYASCGKEALNLVSKDTPDIIFLDIMMPDLDGFQVCKNLKSNVETKEIPIVFLSAMDTKVNKKEYEESGAVDYLTKPINVSLLKTKVQEHITI